MIDIYLARSAVAGLLMRGCTQPEEWPESRQTRLGSGGAAIGWLADPTALTAVPNFVLAVVPGCAGYGMSLPHWPCLNPSSPI